MVLDLGDWGDMETRCNVWTGTESRSGKGH